MSPSALVPYRFPLFCLLGILIISCILFPFCFCISLCISLFISYIPFLSLSFIFCLSHSSNYKLFPRTHVSRYRRHSDLPPLFLAPSCQDHNLSFDFLIPSNMINTVAVRPCLMLPRYMKERCFVGSNIVSFLQLVLLIRLSMGPWWNDNWQGKTEVLGEKPLPVTVTWSTTNLNWAGPGIQRCEACD